MFINRIYKGIKREIAKRKTEFKRPYKSLIKNFLLINFPLFIIRLNYDNYSDIGDYKKANPILGIVCLVKESKDLRHWWKFIRIKLKNHKEE